MKKVSLFVALVILLGACNKAAKEAEKARLETERQQKVYVDNFQSMGSTPEAWIKWYISNKGKTAGTFQVCNLAAGEAVSYTYADTIRKGNAPINLYAPKFGSKNATLANGLVIQTWAASKVVYTTVEIGIFPKGKVPVSLVLEFGNNAMVKGTVLNDWLEIDELATLKEYAEKGDKVSVNAAYQSALYVRIKDATGKVTARYVVTQNGTITKI